MENEANSVCEKSISFHFSETNSSVFFSAFDGLLREYVYWPCGSGLVLVSDHVPEPLVIDDALVYFALHGISVDSTIHDLGAIVPVAVLDELLAEVAGHIIVFVVFEGNSRVNLSIQSALFGRQGLDQHPDRHSRRKCVRVNDYVWAYALLVERHLDLRQKSRQNSLLSMSTTELVSDYRIPLISIFIHKFKFVVYIAIQSYTVHPTLLLILILNAFHFLLTLVKYL